MITKKKKKGNASFWETSRRLCVGMCLLLGLYTAANAESALPLPGGFCLLSDVAPDIAQDLRYAGRENFVGRPIAGYEAPVAILTQEAAEALAAVQRTLKAQGLSLVLYDAYRPQRAVDDFAAWAEDPTDTVMQEAYYPAIPKDQLFKRGYIARQSGHSRGSTVDVGLLDAQGEPLDMGCGFDTFGAIAGHGAAGLTGAQQKHRALLLDVMGAHGFRSYAKEWWHYTLREEPFPDTYFDFPIIEAFAEPNVTK